MCWKLHCSWCRVLGSILTLKQLMPHAAEFIMQTQNEGRLHRLRQQTPESEVEKLAKYALTLKTRALGAVEHERNSKA